MRKVEAAARGFDLGHGGVSVLENCRLAHLLVGQHGASQAWPLPQKPIALALLSTFPRNGVPDPNEDEFYEVVYDEDAGHFVMRRRADAPPLELPPAPLQRTMREQFSTSKLKTAAARRDGAGHQERERRRERLNSEAAERMKPQRRGARSRAALNRVWFPAALLGKDLTWPPNQTSRSRLDCVT